MFKQTKDNIYKIFGILCALFVLAAIVTLHAPAPTAHAAPSTYLNFQGRLLSNTGALVPDGYYNINFKIYNVATDALTPKDSNACTYNTGTADPGCVWIERYYDTNGVTAGNDFRVRVTNGYFSVQLGSQTAFSGINWDQQLWLVMNIGGSAQTATPTYDGEMTPRIQLTAVPLAFVANNVNSGSTSAASTNSAATTLQSGNTTGTTSNTGSVTLQSGNATSGNSGNITIDAGTASGTKGTITLGASNASALTLGRAGLTTTNAGALTVTQLLTGNAGLAVTGTSTITGLTSGAATALTVNNSTSTGSIFEAQDNGTAVFTIADGGATTVSVSLGIGTTATAPLTVSAAPVNIPSVGISAVGAISGSSTLTSGTSAGIYTGVTATPGSTSTSQTYGLYAAPASASANFSGGGGLVGVLGLPTYSGSGTLNTAYGGYFRADSTGTGTINAARSIIIDANVKSGGGAIGENTGLFVVNQTASTNNNNNIVIGASAPASGNYSIYNSSAYQNVFAGNLRVGSTVAPTVALDVTGAGQFSGNLTVQGGTTTLGTTAQAGSLIVSDGSSSTITFKSATQVAAVNYDITVPAITASDTLCLLTLANCSGSGATSVGTLDTATTNAFGGHITAGVLYLQSATATLPGLVNNAAQTFAGVKTFNNNIILAATASLQITGDITANRPASPTEGQVWYDTTTKRLIVYSNGKWQADRSASTIIIAASNASQAVKDAADVVVNGDTIAAGDGDQVEINAALIAVAGGTVYLTEGTFTVDAAISIPNNTTLSGAGRGTLIQLADLDASANAITNTTTDGSGTGVVIRNLRMDGDDTNNTGAITQYGIYMNVMGSGNGAATLPGARIENVNVDNFETKGIYLNDSDNSIINSVTATGNTGDGLGMVLTNYTSVTNSLFAGNGGNGLQLTSTSTVNVISNNVATSNVGAGFRIGSDSNSVSGNSAHNNLYGIELNGTQYSTVSNNFIRNSTTYGIYVHASTNYSTISSNKINDTGGNTTNNAIYVNSSSSNNIFGNDLSDSTCTTNCYAINISNSASVENYLADNRYSVSAGTNQATINDAGVGTRYASQLSPAQILQFSSSLIKANLTSVLTGTIDPIASTTLTGVGTKFTTELQVGDRITVSAETRTITAIASDTSLTVDVATTNTANDLTPDRLPAVLVVKDSSGNTDVVVKDDGSFNVWGGTVVVGTASQAGSLAVSDGSSNTVTILAASTAGDYTATIPTLTGNDTFCLVTLANCGGGSGATSVGTLDTATTNAFGGHITAGVLYLQSATATLPGLVNNAAQTFAGVKTFNNNIILAATASLQITGDITANRPASPVEGMIFYDTTTKSLIVYSNGKWQADRSESTLIVGTSAAGGVSTAVASVNFDRADYVNASTTSAQTVINTALSALPANGGTVYLMEGTYIIDGSINIPNNVKLSGTGPNTVIKIKNATVSAINAITNTDTTTGTRVFIQDIRIDGNKANQSGAINFEGIYFNNMGGGSGSSAREGGKITNVEVRDIYFNGGASAGGIYLESSNNCTLTGNTTQNNGSMGLNLHNSSNDTITGNISQGNTGSGIFIQNGGNNTFTGNTTQGNTANGIFIDSSNGNTITGNTSQGNTGNGITTNVVSHNTFSSNSLIGNTINGIFIDNASSYITATGNTAQGNAVGIKVNGSDINTISGNTTIGNTTSGISIVSSSTNIVTANTVNNNGGSTTNEGVVITSSNYNTVTSNYITDSQCTVTCNAINITNSASNKTYLADNRFTGSAANAASINDAGTGTIYAGQQTNTSNNVNNDVSDIRFRGSANSTTALTVQNTAGTGVLTVDTTNSQTVLRGINSDAVISGTNLAAATTCSGTNWAGTGPWTHTTGSIVALTCTVPATVTNGATYQVTYTEASNTTATNTVAATLGGVISTAQGANATHTVMITTTATTGITFTPTINFNGSVNTIVINLVTTANSVLTVQNSGATATLELRGSGTVSNTFVGLKSGQANTTGSANTALGSSALQSNTTGQFNTGLGYLSLQDNTTGSSNTALGNGALQNNTSGSTNIAIGSLSLQNNSSGSGNIAIGQNALQVNSTANDSIAIGASALNASVSGAGNIAIGISALANATTAADNTAIGYNALAVASGGRNTALGSSTGGANGTGFNNTYLGANAGFTDGTFNSLASISNSVALGWQSTVQASNSVILGGQDTNAVNVGIGTTIPTNTLSVSPIQLTGASASITAAGVTVTLGTAVASAAHIGDEIIIDSGSTTVVPYKGTITAAPSSTTYTVTPAAGLTYTTKPYRVHYMGLQVKSDGTVFTQGNSTTQFSVLNGAGTGVITVDASTATSSVKIGTSDTTGTLLVLDTKTTIADPTGVAGGMYYNSSSKQFRCYENGSWENCVSGLTNQDSWWIRSAGGTIATTAFVPVGTQAPTVTGTMTSNNASDAVLTQVVTGAVAGNSGGYVSPTFNITRRSYNTSCSMTVRTAGTLPTGARVFVGLIDAAPANANDTGGNHIGFRYSTVAGDTGVSTGWRASTRNGTTNTIAAANVGSSAAVAINTTYKLKMRIDDTNATVYMSVNGGTEDAVTLTLPVAATPLGYAALITSSDTNADTFNIGKFYCEQN